MSGADERAVPRAPREPLSLATAGRETVRVAAEGAELAVTVAGPPGAPAVVFLHGFPLSRGTWEPQIAALEDRWRVIAPDLRGMGDSGTGDGQYAMDVYADDLFVVLDTLDLDEVVACGLSMGGYVLLRALEREPGRFRAAVLADTRSTADDDEGRLRRVAAARAIKRKGVETYARQFVEIVLGRTTLARRADVVEAVRETIAGGDPLGLAGAQLAMASRTDTTHVLEGLEIPVLVVVGEEDDLTPREGAGAMAEALPDGRLAVLPHAGHLSNLENPEAFDRALVRFLEEVAPPE